MIPSEFQDPANVPSSRSRANAVMATASESLWLDFVPTERSRLPDLEFADREHLAHDLNAEFRTSLQPDDLVNAKVMQDLIDLVEAQSAGTPEDPVESNGEPLNHGISDQSHGDGQGENGTLLWILSSDAYVLATILADLGTKDMRSIRCDDDVANVLRVDPVILLRHVQEEFQIEISPIEETTLHTAYDWLHHIALTSPEGSAAEAEHEEH